MKRAASILALLGCILHATLLPWHAAWARGAATAEAQLAHDLLIICHGDGSGVSEAPATAPQAPAQKDTAECQICKGIVGFQLVVLAAVELGLVVEQPAPVFAAASDDDAAEGLAISPRSRGPPLSI